MFDLNLANALTMMRIFLVPVLVVALLANTPHGDRLGAIIFIIASVTDALDGWIARRRKYVSNFGKLMDPLADKLLIAAALLALVSLDRIAAWVAMVIIAREFAVTGLRLLAVEQGHVIAASVWGKAKTVIQVVMIFVLMIKGDSGDSIWIDALIYTTVAVTVLSGADYFFGLRRGLKSVSK